MKRLAILLLAAAALSAQTFEVASVKRSAPETPSGPRSTGGIPRQQKDPTRIDYPNVILKSVLAFAWGVDRDQISGPQWLDDERYDIAATLPAGNSPVDVPVMLRHLLAERFHMTVHEETKPRAGLALVVGKGQRKFTPSVEAQDMLGFEVGAAQVKFHNITMDQFAKTLSQAGRPVSDQTGIEGHFDITLNATMADIRSGSASGAVEDLGLKLEPHTAPAKFIIVDKADKIPIGN